MYRPSPITGDHGYITIIYMICINTVQHLFMYYVYINYICKIVCNWNVYICSAFAVQMYENQELLLIKLISANSQLDQGL